MLDSHDGVSFERWRARQDELIHQLILQQECITTLFGAATKSAQSTSRLELAGFQRLKPAAVQIDEVERLSTGIWEAAPTKTEDVTGRWYITEAGQHSGSFLYEIYRSGGKLFLHSVQTETDMQAELVADGRWLVATLRNPDGRVHGSIRLCHQSGEIITNYCSTGGEWSADITATKRSGSGIHASASQHNGMEFGRTASRDEPAWFKVGDIVRVVKEGYMKGKFASVLGYDSSWNGPLVKVRMREADYKVPVKTLKPIELEHVEGLHQQSDFSNSGNECLTGEDTMEVEFLDDTEFVTRNYTEVGGAEITQEYTNPGVGSCLGNLGTLQEHFVDIDRGVHFENMLMSRNQSGDNIQVLSHRREAGSPNRIAGPRPLQCWLPDKNQRTMEEL